MQNAKALGERARRHGVETKLEPYAVDAHVFQLFWSFLPEAAEALAAAGAFVRRPPPLRPAQLDRAHRHVVQASQQGR